MVRPIRLIAGCLAAGFVLSIAVALWCAYSARPHGPLDLAAWRASQADVYASAVRTRESFLRWLAAHGVDAPSESTYVDAFRGYGAEWLFAFRMGSSRDPQYVCRRFRVGLPFLCLEDSRWQDDTEQDPTTAATVDVTAEYFALIDAARPKPFATAYQPPPLARALAEGGVVPLRPVWSGLILNALVFGFGLWGIVCSFAVARRFARMRGGRCTRCGYDLRGVNSPRCSECGAAIRIR